MPLDHPESCGCQVCRNYRDRLETDQRAREIHASGEEVDKYQPDPGEWHDPEPVMSEGDDGSRVVVVEHHHHEEVEHRHTTAKADTRDLDRRTERLERKARRRPRRHGILRTVAIGAAAVWVLQSFYPELDVPLVPGVSCATPGGVVEVGAADPTFGLVNPFGLGSKVKELSEEAVGTVAKKAALAAVGGALNVAGDTFRAMASHPPRPEDIRTGLENDARAVGKVAGFVIGAVTGEDVGELVDLNSGGAAGVPVSNGCLPCPTAPQGGRGVEVAARAALDAGWTGDDAVTAVAIAGAESGWNPEAANPSSTARGMWQTMMSYHGPKYDGASWTDPFANARVAHEVYQSQGWSAWTVYTSGAYRSHLDEARAAVAAAQGSDATPVAATTGDPRVSDGGSAATQPVALKAAAFIRSEFGFDGTIGGSADSGHVTGSKHYAGLALDVMTYDDTAMGRRIADYFAGPGFEAFGVENVIHDRRIYNRPQGWHAYTGSSPHTEHVHVDFREDGGTGAVPASVCAAPLGNAAGDGWRVATFNILGSGHTPGTWRQRWPGVPRLLAEHGVSVAGLQEVHRGPQKRLVQSMPGWGSFGDWDAVTVWRTDTWTLEEKRLLSVPMYPGRVRQVPLVRLRHTSGESVWFLNVHNSRNTWARGEALRRELAVVSRLDGPVVWLGDTNDRYFAGRVAGAGFRSAGTRGIDQVTATSEVQLRGTRVTTPLVRATSDHAFVYADMRLATSL